MSQLTATPLMLEQIPFFQGLTPEERAQAALLFQVENHRRSTLLAGRGFQRLEQYQDTVYFLFRGVTALYTVTKQNSRKVLFFLGPGQLLNHNVLDTKPVTLFAEVIEDAILLTIPRRAFLDLVGHSPALTAALLRHYETRLWRMSHQLKNTAGYIPVERKLAIKLMKLAQDFGVERPEGLLIPISLTITQLADFVGIPRETASRACKKLGELGLLRYEDKKFTLPDRAGLAAYYREGQLGGAP